MKTENKKLWTLFVIIAMVSMCGCMGGGSDETTTSSDEPTTTQKTTAESLTTTSPASSGVSLESILGLGKPSSYTIVYDITMSGSGVDDTVKMTQTHYMSDKKFRLDMKGFVGEALGENRIYNTPEGSYVCIETDGEWSCLGTGTQEQDYGFDLEDTASEIEDYSENILHDGTEVIAGVTAQCFKMNVQGISTRYCLHPKYNVPLLMESTNIASGQEGYYKSIATSFKTTKLSDSVFDLPAEPVDLNDMCLQMCMQMPADYQEECIKNCEG